MEKAKLTFKGQVTIPKRIREALSIVEGDSVIFSMEGDHAVVKPLKKTALGDFYGSFPATRPYPGSDAMRKEIHKKMAQRFRKDAKK